MATPTPRDLLLQTLQQLGKDDLESFQWQLKSLSIIPPCDLEGANRLRMVDLLLQHYPQNAVDNAIECLRRINRNDLVQHLSQNNAGGGQR